MKYDIVIIGAGIQGLLIASDLVSLKKGIRLAIVEQNLRGQGATIRTAGFDVPGGKTPKIREMSAYSQHYYRQRFKRSGGYYPVRTLVHSNDEQLSSYFRSGVCRRVSDPLINDSFLSFSHNQWVCSECYRGDMHALLQDLTHHLAEHVDFYESHSVQTICDDAAGLHIHLSSGMSLQSVKCVLCPGPWVNSNAFAKYTSHFKIRTKKIVAFHLEAPLFQESQAHFFLDEDAFLLPMADNRYWLFSYTCQTWDVNPEQRMTIFPEDIACASNIVSKYAVNAQPLVKSGRVFCDAYSENREPIIQIVNDFNNIIFAGAASGSGFRLAPAISRYTIQLLNI